MKKHILFAMGFLLGFSLLSDAGPPENLITLSTLDWEPYIGQNLPDQGYVASLVREAYKAAGFTVDYKFMPWARAVAMARKGVCDGYLPEYYAESLQKDFFVSDPFPGGPLGLFKRKADAIAFRTLMDLKPYTIGVVRDYINTREFDEATYLHKEVADNDVTNFRMLVGKRLDLVVADKFVGAYLLKKDMPDRAGEVEFMSPILEEKNLYLCISRLTPDAEVKIKAFNEGLRAIRENGKLAALLQASSLQ